MFSPRKRRVVWGKALEWLYEIFNKIGSILTGLAKGTDRLRRQRRRRRRRRRQRRGKIESDLVIDWASTATTTRFNSGDLLQVDFIILQAWQKLGTMPPEEAMEKYLDIVTALYPSWLDGSIAAQKKRARDGSDQPSSDTRPMGPVFSSFIYEEESGNELNMDVIHAFAREGDVENLIKCVDSGVSVDLKVRARVTYGQKQDYVNYLDV